MPSLNLVAEFDHQVTGVTVTRDGRTFVNFPRWTEDTEVSVAELMDDGSLRPYPDDEWNRWRNARKTDVSPGDHWVCVQAVVANGDSVWVLDPAAPATAHLVEGGPKLVQIVLDSLPRTRSGGDRVVRTIQFDEDVAPEGSYLNDVRFSPDSKWAYITDSGWRGALVVVDLESGSARRVLDGHPSTQPEDSVTVEIDGAPLRRPDGRGAEFAADSIALTNDCETLYWKPLTGKTLYRIATVALRDESRSADALADAVETVGQTEITDGLWIHSSGRFFLTAPEKYAVIERDGDAETVVVQDDRLRWPDTMSEGPDGEMYVTASHIQDSAWFTPGAPSALPTALFRFDPAA